MKRKKRNFLQKKNAYSKSNKKFKSLNTKGVTYIENKLNNNENTRIVEITPRLSSVELSNPEVEFEKKVEILAEELKQQILKMHEEGNSVRFIADKVRMSRETVRKTIKGECSLKILAMERIRAMEVQQMKF